MYPASRHAMLHMNTVLQFIGVRAHSLYMELLAHDLGRGKPIPLVYKRPKTLPHNLNQLPEFGFQITEMCGHIDCQNVQLKQV